MKYYIDTEFIEGFHKPIFGKRRHFIDLISIGIVAEDGREYYAISTMFNEKDANQWVKENVISKLPPPYRDKGVDGYHPHPSWKNPVNIKKDILKFFGCYEDHLFWRAPNGIEVYGYFADYDWVLFCSLFGTMMDLPKGFPMYCRDLKQMWDELPVDNIVKSQSLPIQANEHDALADARWNRDLYNSIIKLKTP